jgi:Leu/Phe-tRNA-protein transferase
MTQDYYWSRDYSPEFYATFSKAGFIAVTEMHKGEELLLPELQKSYALLDFDDLHIGKKVRKLIRKNEYTLHTGVILDQVYQEIGRYHRGSWLTRKYLDTLKSVNLANLGITAIAVTIRDHQGQTTAGEIGYIIGRTYTSLSGFSSRESRHSSHGTLQLVLLAQWLQRNNFAFWNLGQPYMPYKFALGAKKYPRETFLGRWLKASRQTLGNK